MLLLDDELKTNDERRTYMSEREIRPWVLAEENFKNIKERKYEIAVLPIGATEPHNLHLPYGTDVFESTMIGEQLCEKAWNLGAKVILLPTIPYGTETNQKKCYLSMNLNPSTLYQVITDLIESLRGHGIKKVMILNSHGGNEIKPHLRELYGKLDSHIFLCDWFRMVKDRYHEIFEHAEDHAGEMETSFALRYFPEFVNKSQDGKLAADSGSTNSTRFEAVNQGWVSITRPWHLLTTNTGSGNPHEASAEKGEALMNLIVERVAPFLKELSDSELDESFPFQGDCQN